MPIVFSSFLCWFCIQCSNSKFAILLQILIKQNTIIAWSIFFWIQSLHKVYYREQDSLISSWVTKMISTNSRISSSLYTLELAWLQFPNINSWRNTNDQSCSLSSCVRGWWCLANLNVWRMITRLDICGSRGLNPWQDISRPLLMTNVPPPRSQEPHDPTNIFSIFKLKL